MNIVFFEVNPHDRDAIIQHLGSEHEIRFFDQPIQHVDLSQLENVDIIGIFVYSQIDRNILEQLPRLQLVATMSTGFDHIDLEACKERSVSVCNVASYGEVTVAEHTFALILALSHRLVESVDRVKNGYFSPQGLTGFDLFGKTIGVVGVGGIGRHVVTIAKGFGMQVIGYKRNPDPDLERELGIELVDVPTLLTRSDIVSLHLPYSQETHHLIDEEKFHIMKKDALLINTARGPIVETRALLDALENNLIGGAGLDVVEGEPLLREESQLLSSEFNQEDLLHVIEERMLLHYPNVVITPHNAFNSVEALQRIIETTVENIQSFIKGSPQNSVSTR